MTEGLFCTEEGKMLIKSLYLTGLEYDQKLFKRKVKTYYGSNIHKWPRHLFAENRAIQSQIDQEFHRILNEARDNEKLPEGVLA
jgi:hypothetical protein